LYRIRFTTELIVLGYSELDVVVGKLGPKEGGTWKQIALERVSPACTPLPLQRYGRVEVMTTGRETNDWCTIV
jgi:hypothetical protein